MDYDENDFQSQNFQLVGDENKFLPSVRSFALPKFDLDEHLQVHLRFDNLIDTDILLGIRNQDNNWIEDFSSGTSAVEFSSSAADNCSISKHKNVWSEATSSESVEMLLKSVGEDEMNNIKATTMDDAQNLLSGMITQMDPVSRHVDNDNSMMGEIIQEDQLVPPDKFQRNFLGKDKDAIGFQSQVHGMPQIFNNEISGAELDASSLGDGIQSDQKIVAGQCISDETVPLPLDVTNKKCSVTSEAICRIVNDDEPSAMNFMKESDDRSWDASEVARGSPDPITCMHTQEQVVEEHIVNNITNMSELLSIDTQKDRSPILRHAERNEQLMEGNEVDTYLCTSVHSSFSEPGRDSLMLMSEGCNIIGFSGNPDGLLEAIAYQVNAPKNDTKAGCNSSMHEHEMNTLENESDKFRHTHYVDIGPENICSQLICPNEGTSHTSEVDVNAHKIYEPQLKETEVEKSLEVNCSSPCPHTTEGAFEEKNVEAETVNDVNESCSKSIGSKNVMLGDSYLRSVLDNAEVRMPSSVPDKLPEAAKPSDIHTSSLEVSAGKEDSYLPAVLDNAEVRMPSSVPDKLPEAAEPSDIHTSSLEVSAGKEDSYLPAVLDNAEVRMPSSVPDKLSEAAEPSDIHTSSLEVSAGKEDSYLTAVLDNAEVRMPSSVPNKLHEAAEPSDIHTLSLEVSAEKEDSYLPAVLDNAEVRMPSSVPDKLPVASEPSDIHTPFLEVYAGKEDAVPSTSLATMNINNIDDNAAKGEAGAAITDGQNSDNLEVMIVSPANKLAHDGSVGDLVSVGVGSPSIRKYTSDDASHPSDSLVRDGPREQIEVTSPKALEPESIYGDGKEVRTTGISSISGSNSNLDAPILIEPVIVSDPVAPACSSPIEVDQDVLAGENAAVLEEAVKCHHSQDSSVADVVPEQQERAMSIQFSLEFVQSDEKEAKMSGNSSSIKSKGNVDDMPLAESDITENNPLSITTKPQTVLIKQHSSYVENSVTTQSELQSLPDKPVTQQEATGIERNIVIHGSSAKRKDNSYKPEASSHEKDEAVSSIADSGMSTSSMLTRSNQETSNTEAQLSVDETPKPRLPEQNCGSPTVISCDGHSQDAPEETGNNDDNIKQATLGSKDGTASEDGRNFTFEVGRVEGPSIKGAGQWNPFHSLKSSSVPSKITEASSRSCQSESGRKHHDVITKIATEDKSHVTGSSNEKLTTPRSKPAKGTSTRKKSTDGVGKSCTISSAPNGTVSSGMYLEEIKLSTCTESNHAKSSGSMVVQSASLPDLNSSSTTLFHQPFTDIQQVQLRAQIFVYGSLIQSIPPDEACMQSAFGETDDGRSSWEIVWCKSVERYQNQKSPISTETPLISHSAVRVPEQITKCSSLQSKTAHSSAGRSVGKVIAPANLNATPPLQSPLWSISTHDGLHSNLPRGAQIDFNQALSPLHSYPSSQSRQFASTTSPWLHQNPRPGPWAVSTQSPAINAATQYSTLPVIETVQVTPVRETSIPCPTSVQLASPSPLLPSSSPASVPSPSIVHLETSTETSSPGNKNTSASQKSRKRKKAAESEEFAETIPSSQSHAKAASVTALTKVLPSASPGMPSSANTALKVASEPIVSTTPHISPTQYQIIGSGNTEQRVIFSEETCNKIEQAKLQAESAAAFAASVVSHSQGIWNQLAAQRNSGLVTEVEEKLASAAVAAAAAAAVAKAAAAAAKVASDAALQAKMMADEALDSAKTGTVAQISDVFFDAEKNLTRLTPGSILKGKDKIHGSSSIISAAREAARRRVEAASAATKRAENLDAIMKAAELAAEAVSQVGTIIAMGDPLPLKLSELVEAGPVGSWKSYRSTSKKLNKANSEGSKGLDHNDHNYDQTRVNGTEMHRTATEDMMVHDEQSIQSGDNCQGLGTDIGNSSIHTNDSHENDHSMSSLKENVIHKGSVVEVLSDEDGLRGGWFSAQVLDVKDNKAHIRYNNILSDDGSGQLNEWISLGCEINGAPRVRIAHPLTGMKHDGTRKRRRSSHAWEVGDRVDAWMRDGWWEGIVTEKSQVDETKLTVHFPAGGDTSLVRIWELRPSLTWKDSQWKEWSRARENVLIPYEGDTPQEKRQKLGRTEANIDAEVDVRVIKLSKKILPEDSGKAGKLGTLNLSANDTTFSVGKNASEANISDALKVKRTGLQKEGSRVVFGVPKPGKKRKFMEVSKHYVSDKTETSRGNDSLKFAKYLMPQASRPWRNTSKIDPKGKRLGDSMSLGVKSVKSRTSQSKNAAERDSLSVSVLSTSNVEKNGHVSSSNVRTGINNEENISKKNSMECVSFPRQLGTTGSLAAVSSVQSLSNIPASKKKTSTVEAELGIKGMVTPVLDQSTRSEKKPSENTGKAIPDTVEPRRSNRKIQPTSRLLEGLQSSLIISKIPTLSHDKGSKSIHRSSSSRGNTRGS